MLERSQEGDVNWREFFSALLRVLAMSTPYF
jgi:hypothetical protein